MAGVRSITTLVRQASESQVEEGRNWYAEANTICRTLAKQHGTTVEIVAGVMAALSPQNGWGRNVTLTAQALRTGQATGTLGRSCRAAQAILAGLSPTVVLTGNKVRAFYENIVTAGVTDTVTVDRHAYAIVSGNLNGEGLQRAGVYASVATMYQRAAKILNREGYNLTASQCQAVAWITYRQKLRRVGAFDSYSLAA